MFPQCFQCLLVLQPLHSPLSRDSLFCVGLCVSICVGLCLCVCVCVPACKLSVQQASVECVYPTGGDAAHRVYFPLGLKQKSFSFLDGFCWEWKPSVLAELTDLKEPSAQCEVAPNQLKSEQLYVWIFCLFLGMIFMECWKGYYCLA